MRKGASVALILVGVLLLGATALSYSKYRKASSDFAQATAEQQETRLRYDRAVSEIVTIQDSLNAIVLGKDGERFVPARPLDEMQPPGSLHDTVLSRIATLKSAVERTKERIEELDASLKRSGTKIQGLERLMAGLRRSVSEKEERITQLSTQVDTLQTRVAGLSIEVDDQRLVLEEKQRAIEEKQREISTIYYAVGSKKELTNSGVVESKGGVLGFGKTLEPSGEFNAALFVPLDTDQENIIRIAGEKAQVLSAQPASSYVLQPIGKDAVELRIIDPVEFRKVKHVVILSTT